MLAKRQTQSGLPGQRFIDPGVLARIDNLELVARSVVDGFISGLHRSPMLGMSVDFAEHRAYMPGDDVRRIDWRLFARTDRFFVKEFEADNNANLHLLLDVSRSMDYGSGPVTKLEYAKFIAASLAYLSRRQRDRIGMITFDNKIIDTIPPSIKHFNTVLHALDHLGAGGAGSYHEPFAKIALTLRRRSLVVLISDLYDTPRRLLSAINQLRYRGNDLIVFHLLDPQELSLELGDVSSVEDLETGTNLPIATSQYRDRYRQLIRDHRAELERCFGANQIDYIFADISQPLDNILLRYLSDRERQNRTR
ncbi:MAG: DUF58 domain-containing protein [Gammaproteobacteria bacterium]|jgi:uncharacterized protein (DUF58 family)|nr:DUF58 domain-containing protein [Gammaproteobacteria bacterium]